MKCLCIDGGGSKGFYSLGVLSELEQKYGPLHSYFDYIYGTSTGSIIASLISLGYGIQEIREMYEGSVQKIMSCHGTKSRTKALEAAADLIFRDKNFSDCRTNLAIVATNMQEKRPLIFKTNLNQVHGSKASFKAGFGCMLKDAVIASCSAFPFFTPKSLQTENKGLIIAIDGGFSANNPSLIALLDMKNALKLEDETIRIVSVGTGKFPEKLPRRRILDLFHLYTAYPIIEIQFESTAGMVDSVLRLSKGNVKYVRISKEFTDPELACSLLENEPKKLSRLFQKGQLSFAEMEKELEETLEDQSDSLGSLRVDTSISSSSFLR